MRLSRLRWLILLALCAALPLAAAERAAHPDRARLIVQVTVDQLRGDVLPRFRDRFGAAGFRRLMEHGAYYTNAHYGTGNTFTASGHAVLVTGADTAEHGMVANEWFDRDSGKVMYATFDAKHGQSPVNLTSTTLGDELVAASGGRARAFAVAGKDRSAIIPGGHRGKAFWFIEKDGTFASSSYYYETLPGWVQVWNDRKEAASFARPEWQRERDAPVGPFARPKTTLSYSTLLDALTLSFARELLAQEKLGQGASAANYPDYLAISLSATDYIGHAFGPNSTDYADHLVRLDRTLAQFFAFLDEQVGRNAWLLVLCADHGVDDIPEERKTLGFDADRFYPQKLMSELNAALRARFGRTYMAGLLDVPLAGILIGRS